MGGTQGAGELGGKELAMKTEMARECFCLAAVSSILVRIGNRRFLSPG